MLLHIYICIVLCMGVESRGGPRGIHFSKKFTFHLPWKDFLLPVILKKVHLSIKFSDDLFLVIYLFFLQKFIHPSISLVIYPKITLFVPFLTLFLSSFTCFSFF